MKREQITTRELHARMAQPRCKWCGKLREEHIRTVSGEAYCVSRSGGRFEAEEVKP